MISRALGLRKPRGPTGMVWARVRARRGGGHSPRKGMGQIPEGGRSGNTRTTQKTRGRTEGIAILRCGDTVWARQPSEGVAGGLVGGQVGNTWACNQGTAERQGLMYGISTATPVAEEGSVLLPPPLHRWGSRGKVTCSRSPG